MSREKLPGTCSARDCPASFRSLNGAYREMYLEPIREVESFEKNEIPGRNRRARRPKKFRRLKNRRGCSPG